MPDREKVISLVEDAIEIVEKEAFWTIANGLRDALALLKEQEPMEPITDKLRNYVCPVCGDRLRGGKFCMNCGQAVKWE